MLDVDVNNSEEAEYVRTFLWTFDGYQYRLPNISQSSRAKLANIFNGWGIGFDVDTRGCQNSSINVNVAKKQFKRVKFILNDSKIKYVNGATHDSV